MPVEEQLLLAIQEAIGAAVVPSLTTQSAASDLFEAYVLGILLEAARVEGADVRYYDAYGKPTTQFVFRTSPGYIFSQAQPYTHALIRFQGCPALEAHIGVRAAGKSGVLHECDISVIYSAQAQACRLALAHPRQIDLVLAVECKFYTVALKPDLARSFIGLGVDLGSDRCRFVVNTQSASIAKLLSKHRELRWEHGLDPGSEREVERLRNSFQEVFKNFCAGYP
jgi:hypothetical protein